MEAYQSIGLHCQGELAQCMYDIPVNCSATCRSTLDTSIKSMDENTMDPFYLYGDICLIDNVQSKNLPHMKHKKKYYHRGQAMHRGVITPCVDVDTQKYLNSPAVLKSIHIDDQIQWSSCSDSVSNRYFSSPTVLPIYPAILSSGVKSLIYSGEADAVVDFLGTERWLGSLYLSIVDTW